MPNPIEILTAVLESAPLDATLCRLGSIFWIAWHADAQPRSADAIPAAAGESYAGIFHALLDRGIALAPSAYEVGFLSLAHTQEDIDRFAATLGHVLNDVEPANHIGEAHGSQA